MTIYELLREHYADLSSRFAQIHTQLSRDEVREARAAFDELAQTLLTGIHAERAGVLPHLAFAGLRDEVSEVLRHHGLVEETVSQLRLVQLPPFHWQGVLELLDQLVRRHVAYLEEEVFPFAQLTLDADEDAQIVRDYQAFWPVVQTVAGVSITYDLAS